MLACVDVDYREGEALAACLLMRDWADEKAERELVRRVSPVQPYEPGQFYRRELPCLLAVLEEVTAQLTTVIVDGYVWLGPERPGLGARLYEALAERVPVVGVAKTAFHGASDAVPVLRGQSRTPLYVTAVGMPVETAAQQVATMHGPFRLPTLLKRVDRLCRDG